MKLKIDVDNDGVDDIEVVIPEGISKSFIIKVAISLLSTAGLAGSCVVLL